MSQEPSRQRKWGLGANFWWGTILGLFQVALNAALLYLVAVIIPYPDISPNLGFLGHEDPNVVFLQDLQIIFLLFFFAGLLRGRVTKRVGAATQISVLGCCISALSVLVLPFALDSVVGGEAGLGLLSFVFGGWVFLVMISQLVVGIVGGVLGGLIGSRLLRRRPG